MSTKLLIRDKDEIYNEITEDSIGIIYEYDSANNTYMLINIGNKSFIDAFYARESVKYQNIERSMNNSIKFSILSIDTNSISQDELDKIFNISGYIGIYIEKNKLKT